MQGRCLIEVREVHVTTKRAGVATNMSGFSRSLGISAVQLASPVQACKYEVTSSIELPESAKRDTTSEQ